MLGMTHRQDMITLLLLLLLLSLLFRRTDHWRLTELVVDDRNDGWLDACMNGRQWIDLGDGNNSGS